MNGMRPLIWIFTWALLLEIFVLFYYLSKGTRPFEYYLNMGLMIFTVGFLALFIFLNIRKRGTKSERNKNSRK